MKSQQLSSQCGETMKSIRRRPPSGVCEVSRHDLVMGIVLSFLLPQKTTVTQRLGFEFSITLAQLEFV
jgi:hypothetical protein